MIRSQKILFRRFLSTTKAPEFPPGPPPLPLKEQQEMNELIKEEQKRLDEMPNPTLPKDEWKDGKNPDTGEVDGPKGPEPTRYGDWERKGRVPSKAEIESILDSNKDVNIIPIFVEISGDFLTPVSAYLKLSLHSKLPSFLLESAESGSKVGRYSFIGYEPKDIIRVGEGCEYKGDPLTVIEQRLASVHQYHDEQLPRFTGGYIGYISYECVRFFEPKTVPQREQEDVLKIPDAVFCLFDDVVIFDHLHHTIYIVSNYHRLDGLEYHKEYERVASRIHEICTKLSLDLDLSKSMRVEDPTTEKPMSNMTQPEFESIVNRLKSHIIDGDIIQAVPSQRFSYQTKKDPFSVYRNLRQLNPSPYMFYLDLSDMQIIGASPEMMCKVEGRIVHTHPIAGTRKRGRNASEDAVIANELLRDEKERAEHVMLVDLGRNDVGRVSKPGSVKVDSFMVVEKYRHVMHIVSRVTGELRDDCTPFNAFRSIFPAGTVSGAPKVRAIQLIGEMEKEKRGVYAGAVGYFGYNKDIDTAIAIRTIVYHNGTAYLQAGAGIVFDSVPESEFQETVNKLRSNIVAIEKV